MLQQQLKEATKANHDELESLMFVNEIMNGNLSLHQYKQILTTNYIVHKAFEGFLLNNLSPEVAAQLDIIHRHKLAALIADLDELRMDLPPIVNSDISFDKTDASILGAMYVMEGATLGGSVIVKRLLTNTELNSIGLNFNYYQVYGKELINYWKSFCEVLNQQPEETYSSAVASAKKMFSYIAEVQQRRNKQLV